MVGVYGEVGKRSGMYSTCFLDSTLVHSAEEPDTMAISGKIICKTPYVPSIS